MSPRPIRTARTRSADFCLVIPARQITVLVGSSRLRQDDADAHDQPDGRPDLGHDRDRRRRTSRRSSRCSCAAASATSCRTPACFRTARSSTTSRPCRVLTGVPKAQARKRALELMDTVGLDRTLADRYPSQLSGGQQQRVGVARGLAVDPNILLMDEPFSAVDPIVRDELQQEVLRLQARARARRSSSSRTTSTRRSCSAIRSSCSSRAATSCSRARPSEILANPANDFVATFIGADRGKRRLTVSAAASRGDDRAAGGCRRLPGRRHRGARRPPRRRATRPRSRAASRTRRTRRATPDELGMDRQQPRLDRGAHSGALWL